MISFLLDTLLATGALIVIVMLLRKPVARAFGPQMAYALWLLPLLRLVMPPILLPSSLAPRLAEPVAAAVPVSQPMAEPMTMIVIVPPTGEMPVVAQSAAAASVPWGELVLALWLGGALLFLAWRFVTYRRMRRDLLAEARPVGEIGRIRLVETPAVSGPVAFGLTDKVIALPMHFMTLEDRAARDLAIAHELAHHDGRDLAANIVAQPLLALHWFNPLAWLAWRAMRRDQEAACDARVLAVRDRAERARYAEVIASFAAGPRLALAAPMACPMRAEKSIIHRLRSLKMADIPRRRRLLGRSLLIAGGLALPLTATITYAANEQIEAPETPEAPFAPAAPDAPEAPFPPDAPEAAEPGSQVRTFVLRREGAEGTPRVQHFTLRRDGAVPAPPAPPAPPAAPRFEFHGWTPADDPEAAKKWEEWGEQMEKWGEEFGRQHAAQAQAYAEQAEAWAQAARQNAPEVIHSCHGDPKTVTRNERTSDGRQRIVICERVATRQALSGLRGARAMIARDRNIDPEVRDEVLDDLDSEIERIENEG